MPEASTVDFARHPVPNVNLVSLPVPQVVVGDFDWHNPLERGVRVNWPWLVLQEAVLGLREQHLLHFHTSHARGGYGNIYLLQLGQTVVQCSAFPSASEA